MHTVGIDPLHGDRARIGQTIKASNNSDAVTRDYVDSNGVAHGFIWQ